MTMIDDGLKMKKSFLSLTPALQNEDRDFLGYLYI